MNKLSRFILIALVLVGIALGIAFFAKQQTEQPATTEVTTDSPAAVAVTEQQPPATAEKATEEEASTAYDPAIWKIEHNGVTSYLFGSIHMGDKSMYPLPEKVRNAFANSEVLAVEIDMTDLNQMEVAQTIQQIAINPDKPLKQQLSAETAEKYDEYCEQTRTPCQMFSSFEPWFAAMSLEALSMQKSGYMEQLGIDLHFLNEAKGSKTIVELESLDVQLKMLDEMSPELQDFMLLSVVTRDPSDTHKLVSAWKSGEVETFLEESELQAQQQEVDPALYEAFMDSFLYQRNQGMAQGIAKLINEGKSVFAVVGAAHYAGEKSVNQYLTEMGFTVTRF